ncbi:S-layer homology domain-containing protein [Paenibacillus sp. LS1]|uniref:S-layer homology domain-containing protein n=1 Tax=Paenibacillus sp. LS1 TaxID=2992120 RepID=UPI00222ED3C9|nr:S-layer homology domain-containing protein [Paenibacillus sp. LS1]MCW3790215.1 S-layer homology domain-containing protein [Paenibacillus sp. LS1]
MSLKASVKKMKMRKVWTSLLVLLMSCATSVNAATEAEQSTRPSFELKPVSVDNTLVEISVIGHDLEDLYAYEMNLQFDANTLRFSKASAGNAGYTVVPKVEGNNLQIAHTKVGSVKGDSGDQLLTTLQFSVQRAGKSTITLQNLKLVDSKLIMSKMTPALQETIQTESGTIFSDITGHWAEDSIQKAVAAGFIDGYTDGTFRPKQEVTRAEFAVMFSRALKLDVNDLHAAFADANQIPAWASSHVQAAVQKQFITGYANHTFRPSTKMIRAEMASIAVRALGKEGHDVTNVNEFADAADISAWAKPFIYEAIELNIMQGIGNNHFSPKTNVTRAEAVTVILNVLGNKN